MIETTNINWRYFADSGMPQSGASHILEKYSLSADETNLRLEITVTDPEVFIEPVSSATEWFTLTAASGRKRTFINS